MICRKLTSNDLDEMLKLCLSNQDYYEYCPPMVSKNSLIQDMKALPSNKTMNDKYYVGFFEDQQLIAILDYIVNYPDDRCDWIGFLMVNKEDHRKKIGTKIVEMIKNQTNKTIKLGIVQDNKIAIKFWESLGFKHIDTSNHILIYHYHKTSN